MLLALVVVPVGIAGLYVAREHLLAGRSRWSELAVKYRGSKSANVEWTACAGVEVEIRNGNAITRVSYGRSRRLGLSLWAELWARLFPRLYVAVDTRGLHLKQQPWNFKHPPLLIPWKKILEIRSMSASEHALGKVSRQIGTAAEKLRAPKAVSAVLDAIGGHLACITLASPKMTITLPADTIVDALEYLESAAPAQPAAAGKSPTSPAQMTSAAKPAAAESATKPPYRGRLA